MIALSGITRALLVASAFFWLLYLLGQQTGMLAHGSAAAVIVKGLPVSLLALAMASLRLRRGLVPVLVLLLYAGGDVLLEVPGGFAYGAASFACGHILAAVWLLRFRTTITAGRGLVGAALIQLALLVPVLTPTKAVPEALAMIYALTIALMAGALVISRFPRFAAWGAGLFMASDAVIVITTNGPIWGNAIDGFVVWTGYYAGVTLVAAGIASGLRALDG